MFERYTDRARRVVVLAQEEARMLNHNHIGTEHLLLGLIHEAHGVAAHVLLSLGLTLEGARASVEALVPQGTDAPAGHIPFTPRSKRAQELSLREALQLGHNYIGTEHLLLGLIREGEGVAAQVLVGHGLTLEDTRSAVTRTLSGKSDVEAKAGWATRAIADFTALKLAVEKEKVGSPPSGCWVAYTEAGLVFHTVFNDELDARRYAMERQCQLYWVNWGQPIPWHEAQEAG